MSSLKHCLTKIGLQQHEAAILRGAVKDLSDEGYAAHEAAVTAVKDYISSLEQERSDIVRQVTEAVAKEAPAAVPSAEQPAPGDIVQVVGGQYGGAIVKLLGRSVVMPSAWSVEIDRLPVTVREIKLHRRASAATPIQDVGEKIGGARKDTATTIGQRGVALEEPVATYAADQPGPDERRYTAQQRTKGDGYTQDIFGAAIPETPRAAVAAGAAVVRDAVAGRLDADAPLPANGIFATEVRTRQQGAVRVGYESITSQAQAAHAFAHLRKYPREYLAALIVDDSGKPLAYWTGFIGSTSATSVYPPEIAKLATSVPGAAGVWIAHNHPSGIADPSSADRLITKAVEDLLAGIVPLRGSLVIAGSNYADIASGDRGPIPAERRNVTVPMIERLFLRSGVVGNAAESTINKPAAAVNLAGRYLGDREGLLLLDAQNRLIGVMPYQVSEGGEPRLRPSGEARKLMNLIARTGAAAVILRSSPFKQDAVTPQRVRNLLGMFKAMDVRPLDVLTTDGLSLSERGVVGAEQPVFESRIPAQEGTPQFKRWFGDSKVVDADGKPLVVYHGTNDSFDEFMPPGELGPGRHPSSVLGNFFSTAVDIAGLFHRDGGGANTMPVYLSIKRPFEMTWQDFRRRLAPESVRHAEPGDASWDRIESRADGLRTTLERDGYDGIVIRAAKSRDAAYEGSADAWIAFRPEQIKSAIGNRGTFDSSSSNITESRGAGSGLTVDRVRQIVVGKLGADAVARLERSGILDIRATNDTGFGGEKTDGLYHDGTAYLFADRLTEGSVLPVLMEELGEHYGLQAALGEAAYRALAKRVASLRAVGYAPAASAWSEVKETYPDHFSGMSDAELAADSTFMHEVIAKLGRDEAVRARPWWRDVIAAIRRFLLREFNITSGIDETDVGAFIDGAARRAAKLSGVRRAGTLDSDREPLESRIRKSRQVEPDFAAGMTSAQKETLRKVGLVHEEPTLAGRAAALLDEFRKEFVQGVFDQFAPLKSLSERVYKLARMSSASDGTVEAMLLYGRPFMTAEGGVDGRVEQDGKGGFLHVLQGLDGEQDRFFAWVAGNRAAELKRQGRENLLTDDDISFLKDLNAGQMPDGADRQEAYQAALKRLREFNNAALDIAEKSGLFDPESRALWAQEFYVPFYRVLEEGVGGPSIKSGLVNQYGIKKLKGGTAELNDLLKNTLMNWAHLMSAAAKNRAAAEAGEALLRTGGAVEASEATVRSMGKAADSQVVSFLDNGSRRWLVIADRGVFDALTALNWGGFGPIMKPMQTMKRWLTFGVTVSPTFKASNLIMDTLSAIGTAPVGYNPFKNLIDGWKATAKDSQTAASMLAGGGMFRFGTMLEGDRAQHLKRLTEAGIKNISMLDGKEQMLSLGQKIWDLYQDIGDRSENVNRAAIYTQLRAKGVSHLDASYAARDLFDFGLQGKWALVRFLVQVVPFMNARLQGLYKLGRASVEDRARFGAVVAAVAVASVALMLWNQDDEEWRRQEDWLHDRYWWLRIGGHVVLIPKPFEIGALGTLAERSLQLALDKDMTTERYRQRIAHMFANTFAMSPVPQAVKPILDVYANKDSFTRRPIESAGMERLRPQDRATAGTGEIAKVLGGLGLPSPSELAQGNYEPLSPVQIDHLMRGYFGSLAVGLNMMVDAIFRPLLGRPERPARGVTDVPLIGRFVRELPTGQSRYVSEFYDAAREVEQSYASWRDALKRGDKQAAAEIRSDVGDADLRRGAAAQKMLDAMAALNLQRRRIEADVAATAREKRERLQEVRERQERIAKRFFSLTANE